MSILIKDTTKEERLKIVLEALGMDAGGCEDYDESVVDDIYLDYTEGKKEIAQINRECSEKLAGTVH